MKKRPEHKVLAVPSILIGELIPWKGRWWRVEAYDPAGGALEFQGRTGHHVSATIVNPVLMLEMRDETTGSLKRRGKKRDD